MRALPVLTAVNKGQGCWDGGAAAVTGYVHEGPGTAAGAWCGQSLPRPSCHMLHTPPLQNSREGLRGPAWLLQEVGGQDA